MRRAWLLLALASCEPSSKVGESDGSDASTADGRSADATAPDGGASDAGADAGLCACGPESCGARACGRSACGYPCGTCPSGEFCFAGGTCQAGVGPGTPCVDAFSWYEWGNVWEGDRGLRSCPTDPTQVEECTCSGGGADGWVSCTGTCFTPCVGSVHCEGTTCGPTEYCQGCKAGAAAATYTCRPRDGSNGSCPSPSMVFDVFCDGNEDCAASDKCMDVRGDIITLRCERDDTNGCGLYRDLCTDVGECPGCATSCSPTTFADLTTEAYDLGVCR